MQATDKKTYNHDKRRWNHAHLAILIFLTIVGLYLRIEPALFDAVHFTYDQGVDISFVRALVVDHKISLISRFTGLQGVLMGPLWTWILAIPYVVSGGNPTSSELFLSLIGIAAIWYTYAILKRILSETEAIIAAFYVAVSGVFLAAAHVVLSPYPLTLLMIVYVWFLWEIVEHGYMKFLPWLGLLAGIFFQFEIGFAIFVVPATIIVLLLMQKQRLLPLKEIARSAFLFGLTFLPQILFEFRHDFLMTRAIGGFLTGKNESLGSEGMGLFGRAILRGGSLWEDYAGSVTFIEKSIMGTLAISIPSLFGWLKVRRENNSIRLRFGFMLLLFTIMMYLGFVIYPGPIWAWYRAGMPIVFILLVAIGWAALVGESKKWKHIAIAVFIPLAFIGLKPNLLLSHITTGYEGGAGTVKNQKNALDTIFQDARGNPFDLYVYTPPVYTYVWDHMLFWYAKPKYTNYPNEYGYQRSKKAENGFYLLIEPDDFPDRISGWKGNFESHGKPVKTWELAGGLRLERWEATKKGE
ncbi:MAG: hypothetical protein A2900_03090 [Candidatus Chisholmbacteria bacterium RIFCSPLOWO2_01_FULL_50_28]|uniref:Glycosyltransferase RgtA/B/C/D-like domain-containing protein n=1 Tax=Candidatus Chisholmbacteria bacterium RIFCSPHIGHO2_01_FULL_52_32 TaxID=1797591 RepID=A0A1G1VT34_9BACT|nr:MAG: hypothetical protein A2786_03655 [Candidatus Chisholmbacteria bacterium RIFCSPHIGHO2_01_FULL_52_32]OGY20061.1 MAG: hypothetical protein A2900_03090 [Candidatus Chisholmbacteria bacterium RIFCSPLOWO2_01_FULL_50_28]